MSKFTFKKLDETPLPKTKGKKIDGFRFYEIDGKHYPSITTVLGISKSKELQKWRDSFGEDVANWEMRRAAKRGTATHNLIEQYMKGETPSERSVLPLGMFRLIKPYVDQINNIHGLERIMYSKKLTFAGQVDCIAEYNGKLSVIDFQTANKERQESWIENYFLQTCAYAMMYEELYGTEINQLVILIAGEDGSMVPFVKERKPYEEKLGLAIQGFYKHYEEMNKNKIKVV
jgi:genome maintenance exonuclease 1